MDGEHVIFVGAAATDITPPVGTPMAGYAARTGPAAGVLDGLRCRVALVGDGQRLQCLVVCDVLSVTAALAAAVREHVCAALGVSAADVAVCATHTHCGPALTGEGWAEQVAVAAGRCAVDARAALRPVRLFTAPIGYDDLVRNRRDPAGPVAGHGLVVTALDARTAEPVLTVVNLACHATVLAADTCAFSRDFPGAAVDAIEAACGGTAVFVQGFAGESNPVRTGSQPQDMTGFGALIGTRAAEAVLRTVRAARGGTTINLSWDEPLEARLPPPGREIRPAPLAARLEQVAVEAQNAVAPAQARAEHEAALAAVNEADGEQRRRQLTPELMRRWARMLIADNDSMDPADPVDPVLGLDEAAAATLPVQVMRLGQGLCLAALPGEPFLASARSLQAVADAGELILAGYANASPGYLPPVAEWPRGGYEVGMTRHAPGTAERLVDRAGALLRELGASGER